MTSESRGKPRKGSLFVAYFVLGVLLAYLSPHLLSEEAAKRAMASLTAPFVAKFLYPDWKEASLEDTAQTSLGVPEGEARPPITLALVTDDDLQAYRATYPLPYSFHADRLDSIASRSPSAIFVDVAFLDERPDVSIVEFVQTLCHIGLGAVDRKPVPLFLASLDYMDLPLRNELKAAALKGCFREVAVPRLTDRLDRNNWQYALQVTSEGADSGQTMDSPALAMYKALRPAKEWSNSQGLVDLALIWGLSPHSYNAMRMRDAKGQALCRDGFSFWRDIPVLGGILTDWLGDPSGLHGKPFCPYHASMPMYFLSSKTDVADTLLRGRVVIYAVDLQSVGDYAYSPLHDAIPGAYVHAMALDNLLRFGGAYPRAMDFDIGNVGNAATIFPLIMITLVASLVVLSESARLRQMYLLKWLCECGRTPATTRLKYCVFAGSVSRRLYGRLRCWMRWIRRDLPLPVATSFVGRLKALVFHESCRFVWFLSRTAAKLFVSAVLLIVIGWVAIQFFNLGAFSWLEYAVLPMVLATFKGGEGLAKYIDQVCDALLVSSDHTKKLLSH